MCTIFFFFNDTATTEIYTYGHTLSLHDAIPILVEALEGREQGAAYAACAHNAHHGGVAQVGVHLIGGKANKAGKDLGQHGKNDDVGKRCAGGDRKSTRLNSSH